ncbi:putative F-box protein At1g32420 [Cucumis sativus]|uniref:F-box domain-containing protein n=1 Tax=Cucumis sativus TaxID=3659 RepID=A0A0A0LSE0_CUCSA|nr:putative F-box protein At1g32420 [Cucumis sativus]
MEITDWVSGLPSDIGKTIFSKLLVSNLPACRVVCKAWNELILDHASSASKFLTNDFILFTCDVLHPFPCPDNHTNPNMHCLRFDNLDLDLDLDLELEVNKSSSFEAGVVYKLINSCNGLLLIYKLPLCFPGEFLLRVGIFNPMTNEFFQVPHDEIVEYHYGFGFIPATKQYKLFRVNFPLNVRPEEPNSVSHLDVLTFGRSEIIDPKQSQWRRLYSLPGGVENHGAHVNGVIYWLGEGKEQNEYVVYTLDVETEKIQLSAVLEVVNPMWMSIQQFNGTVYAVFHMEEATQVWRMQEKNSWIRDFVIDDCNLTLVKAYENGEMLCMVKPTVFWLYNPSTGSKKVLSLRNEKKIFLGICHLELNFGSLLNILAGDESVDEVLIKRNKAKRSRSKAKRSRSHG